MKIYEIVKFKIQAQPKAKLDQNKKPTGEFTKGVCVGYIDSRDCQEMLDEKYGIGGRQNKFYEIKDKTFCSVGLKINDERIRKSDSGALSESQSVDNDTTSKGETSDAFKRACVMRGIGRELYDLPTLWISNDEYMKNKRSLDSFIKTKYKSELNEWAKECK